MKKKEIEKIIKELIESGDQTNQEFIDIVMVHLRNINDACNKRHCKTWGYTIYNPFEDMVIPLYYDVDDEYVVLWFEDEKEDKIVNFVAFKNKDLYDFDYCKYAKRLVNEEIANEKRKIEQWKKSIRKSSDRITELKHHIKGEC